MVDKPPVPPDQLSGFELRPGAPGFVIRISSLGFHWTLGFAHWSFNPLVFQSCRLKNVTALSW